MLTMEVPAVFAILLHVTAAAAATIHGVVTDPSGRPVPRARVRAQPPDAVAVTGPEGEFSFESLAPGQYTITAESDVFEPVRLAGVRVEESVPLRLALSYLRLRATHMQVDVLGSGPEPAHRQIPGSAFVIDGRMLAESRPADANEILRQAPGLHVREDSGPAAMRLNIGVRGLNPDRTRTLLVLEDGLPIALAPYGEPEMYYSPPIDRMSRVEILKGSGSIAHGPQTIGGVLNFITPDPPLRNQGGTLRRPVRGVPRPGFLRRQPWPLRLAPQRAAKTR